MTPKKTSVGQQVEPEKQSAKKKDKRDKKAPLKDEHGNELKRPLSAYMLFNNYRRPVLRLEHTGKSLSATNLLHCLDLSITDLSKLIGQEWAKLNESQQKVSHPFY